MEANAPGDDCDVRTLQVKTEVVDENPSAPAWGSPEPPAPYGDSACRGGAAAAGSDEAAEVLEDAELQTAAATASVLLCEFSVGRFLSRFYGLLMNP